MPAALMIAPTLIIAGVLAASGLAKLRAPDDAAGWAELGIPAAMRQRWMIRTHPVAELALAAALLLLGGILGTIAAVIAALLFLAYLVLVWRARRRAPDAACACFGRRRVITARTVLRNAWLFAAALASIATIGASPLWGGVAAVAVPQWHWILAVAAVVVTLALTSEPEPQPEPETVRETVQAVGAGADADLEEYVRVRTPAVPVKLGNGETVNLRTLSMTQPMLLLAVSEGCMSCVPVIGSIDAWRALLPEVSIRFLLQQGPESSTLRSSEEPQSLHDPNLYVRGSLGDWFTPAAVLLGADGMLAGGPVSGAEQIAEFIGDIYESLHGRRPPTG